ncbi:MULTISPECIES: ferrous iron transport protein B [Clostridium]|uniref:ferrous iron transport protein B n=1 Tax=Clostridium TaxID=1485 RepID=UPI000C08B6CD|nr:MULTISPECIES: ferrous iron transport protein B [Clostridium]MBS7130652.1 ferrous iron transport protein B [Clostridium sp.]MDU2283044.1 ferrous iron transport protein B [Clostridium sp.]MDU5739765.1 ferrous iron transport protein B [Clostridium sp.]MDU5783550.1 ferrous iron transport protein B [Clostridium sp.]
MSLRIALAGNPNCGKTTLFNELTGSKQHVGNWPGVTVDKKEGKYKKDNSIEIVDLPGTYSLSPYSAEEIIARDYIVVNKPDVVIDIVDGTNIERNLYLSLQILETRVPTVIAINMMDEVESNGDKIDTNKLSKYLGVPVVPIIARSGKGISELMNIATKVGKEKSVLECLDIFDNNILEARDKIKDIISCEDELEKEWRALKLVEGDEIVTDLLSEEEKSKVLKFVEVAENNADGDTEARIADLRYQFIGKIVRASVKKGERKVKETKSDKIDRVLTNRFLALPIFAVVMYLLFACTFSENFLFIKGFPSPGVWLAGLVEKGWEIFSNLIEGLIVNSSSWVYSLVMDGILNGIGAVIGFIPLVLILYILISFLEDSGYMARVAFVMDRIFRRFGLSGRSFIPLLMGFGCGVPAIMATRTLDSEKDRKITTIITGFMPCGAKLPIFAMFVSIFFKDGNKTLVTYSIYMLSIAIAIIVSLLLNKFVYKSEVSNFVMELPQYRIPTAKSIGIHGWEKVKDFAVKAGTVIFISTILIWGLSNFNVNSFNGVNKENNEDGSIMCDMEESFLASAGNIISPVFKPLGFGEWKPAVGVVTGWVAKENVVVTFAQLYDDVTDEYLEEFFSKYTQGELEELGFECGIYDYEAARDVYSEGILFEGEDENALSSMKEDISSKAAAYAYMAFNLLCMPCFAAVGAMKRELKSWKLTGMAISVQMVTAYIVALLINIFGSLIG